MSPEPDTNCACKPPSIDSIVARYRDPLIRHLSRIAPPGEAEDLVQVTLARVARALETFRGESGLSTWIFRIATRAAIDHLRSRAHRETRATVTASEEAQGACGVGAPELEDPGEGVHRSMDREEMGTCVREFVDRLPHAYAQILALSEFEDLSNAAIAIRLGISVDAAKIRLHRARAALKQELEAGCELYLTEENTLACDRRHPCSCPH